MFWICTSCYLLAVAGVGGGKGGGKGAQSGGGSGQDNQMLCPKCGSPCEHVATLISSTRQAYFRGCFFLIVSDTVPKHGFSSRVADYFAGS